MHVRIVAPFYKIKVFHTKPAMGNSCLSSENLLIFIKEKNGGVNFRCIFSKRAEGVESLLLVSQEKPFRIPSGISLKGNINLIPPDDSRIFFLFSYALY